jgi:hypothetical protein
MKTQTPHVVGLDMDQLFALLMFAGERVSTIKGKQGRSWVVLQAFMTLLRTRQKRTADVGHRQPQNSGLPKGVAFAVRYVSP